MLAFHSVQGRETRLIPKWSKEGKFQASFEESGVVHHFVVRFIPWTGYSDFRPFGTSSALTSHPPSPQTFLRAQSIRNYDHSSVPFLGLQLLVLGHLLWFVEGVLRPSFRGRRGGWNLPARPIESPDLVAFRVDLAACCSSRTMSAMTLSVCGLVSALLGVFSGAYLRHNIIVDMRCCES